MGSRIYYIPVSAFPSYCPASYWMPCTSVLHCVAMFRGEPFSLATVCMQRKRFSLPPRPNPLHPAPRSALPVHRTYFCSSFSSLCSTWQWRGWPRCVRVFTHAVLSRLVAALRLRGSNLHRAYSKNSCRHGCYDRQRSADNAHKLTVTNVLLRNFLATALISPGCESVRAAWRIHQGALAQHGATIAR